MKRLQFLFVYLKILIQLIYRFLTKGISSLSVARIIALSFLFAIFFGSILLYLVELHNPTKPLSYTDALYMSTSAFCVTGLAVVPLSSFTLSGQICILLFIKLGGLGIIIFTVLAGMLLIKGISRNTKLNSFLTEFLDDNKNTKSPEVSKYGGSGVFRAIISIFQVSIIIELIGALFLYFSLPDSQDIEKYNRFFLSLFTSISAFNNAGFSLTDNLNFLRSESFPLFVVSVLIILGGIGFPVVILIEKIFLETMKNLMYKLEAYFENSMMRRALSGKDPKFFHVWVIRLSYYFEERFMLYNQGIRGESNLVQSKIILYGTFGLIVFGTLFVLFLEYDSALQGLTNLDKFMNAFFLSVSSRTAGFSTFDLATLKHSSIVLICLLMFVGGGPQGTAGGIKITTFAILLQYLKNVISTSQSVHIFGETISKRSVAMSIRLYFLATTFLASMGFILTVFHENKEMHYIFFEMISAFCTVGFSLNFTEEINQLEKLVYSGLMYFGRIGILTTLVAITGFEGTTQLGEIDDDVKLQIG